MSDTDNDQNDNLIDDAEEATIGMSEIDGFDFERAVLLMTVIEKCANVAAKATPISGLAQAALEEMNVEAKEIAKRRAEEFKRKEAEARAAVEAKQREDADAPDDAPRMIPTRKPAPAPDNGRRL